MVILALISGLLLAGLTLVTAWGMGAHQKRVVYAVLLGIIALFYPLFALQDLAWRELAFQAVAAAGFVALAYYGYRRDRRLIILGLYLHALYDVIGGFAGFHAPGMWPGFCLAYDVAIAVAARMLSR